MPRQATCRQVPSGVIWTLSGFGLIKIAAFIVMFCMKDWVVAWGGYFGLDVSDQLTAIDEVRQTLGCDAVMQRDAAMEHKPGGFSARSPDR